MALRTTAIVEIGGRSLSVSNLDKVLFPDDGFTKGDVIAYYRSVAAAILPHLRGRPLTLQRYPNGIDGSSFFEKEAPRGTPAWMQTVTVASDGGAREVRYLLCDDEASLAFVANLAAIVLHVWTSRVPDLDAPDYLLFDLDPWEGCTLSTLARVTLRVRESLLEIGLEPLVKSTGGSGLHVMVPLADGYTYDFVKGFAELVARRVNALEPDRTTLQRALAKRDAGTVYLDWVQVGRGKTYVVPYGLRARAGAPVSCPLRWDEVEAMARKRARSTEPEFVRYSLRTVPKRLATFGDPWTAAARKGQRLDVALGRARKVWRT
ncbi:MAG: non-homologous end-joining DNA ligase [Candidatus Baltobacteraceae bacterium]